MKFTNCSYIQYDHLTLLLGGQGARLLNGAVTLSPPKTDPYHEQTVV